MVDCSYKMNPLFSSMGKVPPIKELEHHMEHANKKVQEKTCHICETDQVQFETPIDVSQVRTTARTADDSIPEETDISLQYSLVQLEKNYDKEKTLCF